MGKFYLNKLPEKERIRLIAEFYDAVSCLKNRKEARLFFKDLLSPDEIAMLVRRIEVALLLQAGYSYREIQNVLGVGGDKVVNVQKSLMRSGEGYKLMIKRLRKILKKREQKKKKIDKAQRIEFPSFDYLKKKYPGHFFLFDLLEELNNWLNDDGRLEMEREIEWQGKRNKTKENKKRQKRQKRQNK